MTQPASHETPSSDAVSGPNRRLIRQGRALVAALDDDRFCASDTRRSSVGAHLRHVIDCYRCFLRGYEAGQIDYDGRQRDSGIECDRQVATHALEELDAGFAGLPVDLERPVKVRVDAAAWGTSLHWQHSTLGRELQFLISHTVHHYALIALILRNQGFEPEADFGIAPSTLEHRAEDPGETATACAR